MERKAVSCLSDPGSVLAQALVTEVVTWASGNLHSPQSHVMSKGSDPWRKPDPGGSHFPMVVGGREPKEVQARLLGRARVQKWRNW